MNFVSDPVEFRIEFIVSTILKKPESSFEKTFIVTPYNTAVEFTKVNDFFDIGVDSVIVYSLLNQTSFPQERPQEKLETVLVCF